MYLQERFQNCDRYWWKIRISNKSGFSQRKGRANEVVDQEVSLYYTFLVSPFSLLLPTGGLFVDYFGSNFDPPPFPDKSSIDDSYRGYSITFGEFSGDSQPDVAVGLPRAPDHKGQVSTSFILPICTNNLGSWSWLCV